MLSDFIKYIIDANKNNEEVVRRCKIALVIIGVIFVVGIFSLGSVLISESHKAQMASTHYNRWYEQLPSDSLFKQEMEEYRVIYELMSVLGTTAGSLFNSQEAILKYQLGQLDITELGIFEAYLSKKFDEAKSEYLLLDTEQQKSIKKIEMVQGNKKTIALFRNGEELSFTYVPPGNLFKNGKTPELHQIISLGFVKPYVEDLDIARIVANEITAIKKGSTKLILVYGTQLIECPIKVK